MAWWRWKAEEGEATRKRRRRGGGDRRLRRDSAECDALGRGGVA